MPTPTPPHIGIVPDSTQPAQGALAEEYKKTVVDIQSKLFDKSATYTNLILLAGYAGSFTIWSNTKEHLPKNAVITIALLLGFSLSTFVFFEICKMVAATLHFHKVRYLLSENRTLAEFFEKFNELEHGRSKSILRFGTLAAAVVLITCGATAVSGLAILFYNFVAILIGWSLWPS